jgi:hypothetical protein
VDNPYQDAYAMFGQNGHFPNIPGLFGMAPKEPKAKREPKLDAAGNLIGIAPRLASEFVNLVDACVKDLNAVFRDGLEVKCQVGAKEVRGWFHLCSNTVLIAFPCRLPVPLCRRTTTSRRPCTGAPIVQLSVGRASGVAT